MPAPKPGPKLRTDPVARCVDCGTPGGACRADRPDRPRRINGRCKRCDDRERNRTRVRRDYVPVPASARPRPALELFVPRSVPAPEPKRAPSPRYAGTTARLVEAFDNKDLNFIYGDEEDAA